MADEPEIEFLPGGGIEVDVDALLDLTRSFGELLADAGYEMTKLSALALLRLVLLALQHGGEPKMSPLEARSVVMVMMDLLGPLDEDESIERYEIPVRRRS